MQYVQLEWAIYYRCQSGFGISGYLAGKVPSALGYSGSNLWPILSNPPPGSSHEGNQIPKTFGPPCVGNFDPDRISSEPNL